MRFNRFNRSCEFLKLFFRRSKSSVPTPNPIPMIGPMSGEISIAPMMTAVEFMFRPREAIKIAKTRTQRLGPLKMMPSLILLVTSFLSVRNPFMEKYFFISVQKVILSAIMMVFEMVLSVVNIANNVIDCVSCAILLNLQH